MHGPAINLDIYRSNMVLVHGNEIAIEPWWSYSTQGQRSECGPANWKVSKSYKKGAIICYYSKHNSCIYSLRKISEQPIQSASETWPYAPYWQLRCDFWRENKRQVNPCCVISVGKLAARDKQEFPASVSQGTASQPALERKSFMKSFTTARERGLIEKFPNVIMKELD